jgi:Ku70/Ku80 beta-barrel domain
LEGLFEAIACFVSDRAVPGHYRTRKDQLSSAQQGDRQPVSQGRCRNRRRVPQDNIIKGYEVGKAEYIELDPEELEAVAIESKHTLEIEEFVPKKDIDELYLRDPYYIVPDGDVGQQEVDIYLADLKSCVSAMTVHSRICRLRRAAQYMAPGRDFSWLAEIAKDLAFSHPTKAARL